MTGAKKQEESTTRNEIEKEDKATKKLAREQKKRLSLLAKGKTSKEDVSQVNTTYVHGNRLYLIDEI